MTMGKLAALAQPPLHCQPAYEPADRRDPPVTVSVPRPIARSMRCSYGGLDRPVGSEALQTNLVANIPQEDNTDEIFYPSSRHFMTSAMKSRILVANARFRLHFISVRLSFVSLAKFLGPDRSVSTVTVAKMGDVKRRGECLGL